MITFPFVALSLYTEIQILPLFFIVAVRIDRGGTFKKIGRRLKIVFFNQVKSQNGKAIG